MEMESSVARPMISAWRTLPEDILWDIFIRLPDKSLVRLKVLSKGWHLSISRMCGKRSEKPVVGLFVESHRPFSRKPREMNRTSWIFTNYFTKDYLPRKCSLETMIGDCLPLEEDDEGGRSMLSWDDCTSSFGLPFRPCPYQLLGCCNGLLLFAENDIPLYYVCNPLTRQSVSIPRLPFVQKNHLLAALAFDPSHESACYKVVRFEWQFSRDYVILDIYSSSEKSWCRHTLQVDPCLHTDLWQWPVMYFDGSFFLLSMSCHLIRIDMEGLSVSLTSLPLGNELMGRMGVHMGRVMYAKKCCGVVYVWSLEKIVENEERRWDLKHKINIYDLTRGILDNYTLYGPIAFDPNSNAIYMGAFHVIVKLNLEDNSFEEVSRVHKPDFLLHGCHRPALLYTRWLLPFTNAGDVCDPNFLKFD